MIDDFPSSII